MALCSYGPIQLWPYILMALYSYGPIYFRPCIVMALYSYGHEDVRAYTVERFNVTVDPTTAPTRRGIDRFLDRPASRVPRTRLAR